ncbi:MAG: porin family protein [Bacteroidota bacterium]
MKRIIPLIALVFISYSAQSQILISLIFGDKLNSGNVEFGIDGGFNFSQMSGFESSSRLRTFNMGFYFDITLKDQWFINTGVLVKSNVGLDELTENDVLFLDPTTVYSSAGTYNQKISYFHVPIGIKYRFKNHFYVHMGPQFALRSKAALIYFEESNNTIIDIEVDNRDLFNSIEVAAMGGLGYKLQKGEGINIGIKYMYGFTNIMKDGTRESKNNSLYLSVGIPIGRDKVNSESKSN